MRKELKDKGHLLNQTLILKYSPRLRRMGDDCLNRFRGMFAFAIWDNNRKLLFLARDRLGKKPLVYTNKDRHLAFASEIKALLQIPESKER